MRSMTQQLAELSALPVTKADPARAIWQSRGPLKDLEMHRTAESQRKLVAQLDLCERVLEMTGILEGAEMGPLLQGAAMLRYNIHLPAREIGELAELVQLAPVKSRLV